MKKVKVDIISGFLGAGKTTFIKKMVQDLYSIEKVVVLENEFGKINLDRETLSREKIMVKPIQASCICCTGAGDLINGIIDIIQEYKPDRIIVEPTGIAKLSDVRKSMSNSEISMLCEIEHIVTIVDAKNYYSRMLVSKEFFENQIRASKVIFLSKVDQIENEEIRKVINEIHRIQPRTPVVSDAWTRIDAKKLKEYFNTSMINAVKEQTLHIVKKHWNDFESYEFITNCNLNMDVIKVLFNKIEQGIFGEVHRGKGIGRDSQYGWYSVEYVPGELNINLLPKDKVMQDQLCFCLIGINLIRSKLDDQFNACSNT